MVLKLGHLGQQIRNTWKVLKYGVGEGWRRSVGPIMWEMKKCYLNIVHEIRKRKANWIGHILRRNCLIKQVIEGKIKGEMEVARRRGRRRKKLMDDLKDRRWYSHLKEETLDRTMWRHRFGGGFGPVGRENTEWMNEWTNAQLAGIKYKIQSLLNGLCTMLIFIIVVCFKESRMYGPVLVKPPKIKFHKIRSMIFSCYVWRGSCVDTHGQANGAATL